MYDTIIIGAGAGGIGGALYAARYNMKTLVLSSLMGGAVMVSKEVENYPGTIKATGREMMQQWQKHAETFGAEFKMETVEEIKRNEDQTFSIKTNKETYQTKTILIATGAKERHLGVPGEKEYESRGVSACATCDGMFFQGKEVVVVGGGDAAMRGAQVLLAYCPKVHIVHRREEFRAEPMNLQRVQEHENSVFHLNTQVKEIKGDGKQVTSVLLSTGEELSVKGVFVEIGSIPNIELAQKLGCEISEKLKLINVSDDQSTSVAGVYAAGDVTTASNNFRQLVTAAAEGSIAAEAMFNYIKKMFGN